VTLNHKSNRSRNSCNEKHKLTRSVREANYCEREIHHAWQENESDQTRDVCTSEQNLVSVDKFHQEPEDTETAATIERRAFVVEDPIPVVGSSAMQYINLV
jgi:hypothetical protein